MGNKEWENYLREILGEFKTGGDVPPWDEFAQHADKAPDATDLPESLQDESLRENLANYSPDNQVTGWERIEASLDAADREFDSTVRHKINQYQPAGDPHSWSAFLTKFSAHKLMRTKIIALKIFETAAVLLLLITMLHLGQRGKLDLFSPALADSTTVQDQDMVAHEASPGITSGAIADQIEGETNVQSGKANAAKRKSTHATQSVKSSASSTGDQGFANIAVPINPTISTTEPALYFPEIIDPEVGEEISSTWATTDDVEPMAFPERTQQDVILSPSLQIEHLVTKSVKAIPDPVFVSSIGKSFLEFGMLVQADYNQLKMPEDRVNSDGKQVVFPLQGITSPGYGAGFTLALGHPLWAIETGLIYSSKSFNPGRELTVGGGMDNSNVEFEAMRMQLVSAPLQFRYRFEPKGRLKSYAIAGFGLHLITQSDIDVMVEYNFPSLSEGEDPNNIPSLARTIRQTKRVSDDIRKKAPFSSQSFISANLGVGMEYLLDEHKTLFLQTAYQYQVPNLRFSNHDGKHLLSLSFQAGVRTPLGN